MTHHQLKITTHWASQLHDGRKTAELRKDDRDFQIGDTIDFFHADNGKRINWLGTRRVTHVLKNFPGLEPGYVVLSLSDPEKEYAKKQWQRYSDEVEHLKRCNASLRGQITKLRKRIEGQ